MSNKIQCQICDREVKNIHTPCICQTNEYIAKEVQRLTELTEELKENLINHQSTHH